MSSKKSLLFDLDSWRRENPQASFKAALEELQDELRDSIARIPLRTIRSWLAHHEERLTLLSQEYPELQSFSSLEPERPEEQEFQLCKQILPLLKMEVAQRKRNLRQELAKAPKRGQVANKREDRRKDPSAPGFRHSADYRSVRYGDKEINLTTQQAQVVEILHDAHKNGTSELSNALILERLGAPNSRLRDTFKRSKAWGTLIVRGKTRGTSRLNLPKTPSSVP